MVDTELKDRIKESIERIDMDKAKAKLLQILFKAAYTKTDFPEIDNAEDATFISKWEKESEPSKDKLLLALAKKLKNENTTQSILFNMLSNQPSKKDERSRDRAQVNLRMTEKLRRLIGDARERGDVAAKTIMSIKEDADSHEETKREPISVFINGDYGKYFADLLKLAVQVNAGAIVFKFAKEGVPMILTDKQLDGTEERPIIKRRNKFIRENFGTEANINNELSNSVKNVFEPARKTSNSQLYELLRRIKSDIPLNPYLSEAELAQIEKERRAFQQIYDNFIATYPSRVKLSDIEPYLYTGVDEAKLGSSKEDNESEIKRNVQEIYVRLDLVDSDKMKDTPKAPCKYYDKILENEYLYLTDKRYKDLSRLSKYRDFTFDTPNPLSELAKVAAEEAKSAAEEAASKKESPTEKKGGKRYSRKNRNLVRNKTLSCVKA